MLRQKEAQIFVLPAIVTYCNLFLGVLAIMFSIDSSLENLKLASILLLIAALTDKLDGYVARKYNMTSEFGKQLDSLSDIISFGVAPIFISLSLGLKYLGLSAIITCLIYIGCGVFRLARFNIEEEDMIITGLPITLAGFSIALKHIIDITFRIADISRVTLAYENLVLILFLSFLMISKFKIKKPF